MAKNAPVLSIWKKAGVDLHHGPSTHLLDGDFHFDSEWTEEKGVHFWGNLERDSEEYTLAEVRKIHSAIGRLLAKVDAEPKPTRP